jgi:hypothetical protein
MLSFGVKNLRRLKNVPPIELKPITILVGRNSSGKSSYLRAFPLLRQSLMTRTSSPILWYGDLIDFGSFDISVSSNVQNEPITFSFALDTLAGDEPPPIYWPHYRKNPTRVYNGVEYAVGITRSEERTRISSLNVVIKEPNLSYEILIGESSQVLSVKLNGEETVHLFKPIEMQITPGTILPEMTIVPTEGAERRARTTPSYYGAPHQFMEPIKNYLMSQSKRLKEQWLRALVNEMLYSGVVERHEIQERFGNTGTQVWQRFINEVCSDDKRGVFPPLHQMLAFAALPTILAKIRSDLRAVIVSTLYIGPARARSERYYRYQDLAVSEIDPDGKNFPMFLNSLSGYQISQLSNWIEGLFGYGLNISRQGGGHMSINLVARGMTSNIVDTGYGVSQILPVLGQIWWARSRPRQLIEASLSLIAIEQPELHLHPAHQALLADALVGELSSNPVGASDAQAKRRLHFLIETHSETLLNRIGELIGSGKIAKDDIQVVLFEALEGDDRLTKVSISHFGATGELLNWPYGFFQPSVR